MTISDEDVCSAVKEWWDVAVLKTYNQPYSLLAAKHGCTKEEAHDEILRRIQSGHLEKGIYFPTVSEKGKQLLLLTPPSLELEKS